MRIPSGVTDQYIYFVAVDATDLKTRETGLTTFTVYRSRNGGAAAAYTTPTINETDTINMPGVYELLLDEDMTIDAGNDSEEVCLHITQASMAPVTRTFELYRPKITAGETVTAANGAVDADIERLQGSVIATPTVAGVLEVDITHVAGSAVSTSSAQLGVNVVNAAGTAWGSGAITAGVIAADAIGASELAADAVAEIADAVWDEDATGHQTQGTFGQAIGDPVADTNTIYKAVVTDATGATVGVDAAAILADTGTDGVVVASINANAITASAIADNAIDAGAIAADAITAAKIATGAIDADALASDAVTEIRSLVSGTADSGSTTTMVDAARTEADTDYWKGCFILFTSGTVSGQVRLITGFAPASDTITFAPATTQAVGTNTYEILPSGAVNVRQWLETTVATPAAAGVPSVEVVDISAAGQTDIRSAVGLASANLDTQISGVQADTDNIQTRLPAALVSGRIDASVGAMAAGVVTAAAVATDAIDADALATDAVNEIVDQVWDEATAGHQTAGTTGKALTDASSAGDPWATALPGAYGAGTAGKIVGDNINATVSSRLASASISLSGGAVTVGTNNDKTGYTLSAAGVDDVLDEAVEGSTTLRQMLRGFASALFAKLSGAATTTVTIRDIGDTKNRITATVDADGNRTAVTTDLT